MRFQSGVWMLKIKENINEIEMINLKKLENAQSPNESKAYRIHINFSVQKILKYELLSTITNEATENISPYPIPSTLATVRLSGVNVFSLTTWLSI